MKNVIIGIPGAVLDRATGANRWERWRPTVALCQQEDFLVDRFELLVESAVQEVGEQVAADLRSVSPETVIRSHPLVFDDPWDFESVYAALHDFANAYTFNLDEEQYFVHITTGTHVAQICLFLLIESRHFPAKLIQSSPPRRYNSPEPGEFRIIDLDLSRYDRLAARFAEERRESTSLLKSGIETRNPRFNQLIDQIERVAANSKSPLLLMGATGAGKSKLARKIYDLKVSRRQLTGPFVEVNCATLRGDGAMSALFGHVKGAFTGAVQDRPGLLRSAHEGLLFLDEVGELGADEQATLLRAVEEKRFFPVGSDREAKSNFQLIAGTNRDLARRVADGEFREDLLARINLWTFELPPLRERPEDIEPNLRYELDEFARQHGVKVSLNREAHEHFLQFATSTTAAWSGNFRDLNAAVTRMATLAAGGRISREIVDEEIIRLQRFWTPEPANTRSVQLEELLGPGPLSRIDPFDQVQLAEVIRVCRNSRSLSEAGRTLFAASRQSKKQPNDADRLRKYLARFNLDWKQISG